MTSKVLPTGTMLIGYMGAISSSMPAIAILTSSSLRKRPMFQTMANLALSETWFLFCGGVLGTTNVVGIEMTPGVCAAFQGHNVSAGIGGTAALLVVCVERFVSVVHGLRYETLLSPRRMRLLLLFPWLVWLVSWVTLSSLANAMIQQRFGPAPLHCRFMEVLPPVLKLASCGTPMAICAVIAVLNVIISRVAVRHQRAIRQQRREVGLASQKNVNAYWGVLKVTVIYILFQTPANVLFLLELLWKPQSPALSAISTVFVVLIVAIDGWFFGYYNTTLRRRYAQLFGCQSQEQEQEESQEDEDEDDGEEQRSPRTGGGVAGVVHVCPQQPPRGGTTGHARVAPIKSGSPTQGAEHAEAGRAAVPIWVVPQVLRQAGGEALSQAQLAGAAEAALEMPVKIGGERKTYGGWCGASSVEAAPTHALVALDIAGMRDGRKALGALPSKVRSDMKTS